MNLPKRTVAGSLLAVIGLVCMSVYILLRRKFGSHSIANSRCESADSNDLKNEKVKDLLKRDFYDL